MKDIDIRIKLQEVSSVFRGAEEKAAIYVKNTERLAVILKEAQEKFERTHPALGAAALHLQTFLTVVEDLVNGKPTEIPAEHIHLIVSGVVYFISPCDVFPDFIVGFGFIDDIFIIGLIAAAVNSSIEQYNA